MSVYKEDNECENVGQLREFLKGIPDDTKIVTKGHYGEVDGALCGVSHEDISLNHHTVKPTITAVVLSGFGTTYDSPD